MKKTFSRIGLGVVLVCIVLAVCFWASSRNKQDSSFLNYKNLVAAAAQYDTISVSKAEDTGKYIVDGSELSHFLDTADWTIQFGLIRDVQRDTEQNSRASFQIKLDSAYLKVFDTDTVNIYDESIGKDRYYRMSDGDYEALLAMLIPLSD